MLLLLLVGAARAWARGAGALLDLLAHLGRVLGQLREVVARQRPQLDVRDGAAVARGGLARKEAHATRDDQSNCFEELLQLLFETHVDVFVLVQRELEQEVIAVIQ